jgi:hypothetical protein
MARIDEQAQTDKKLGKFIRNHRKKQPPPPPEQEKPKKEEEAKEEMKEGGERRRRRRSKARSYPSHIPLPFGRSPRDQRKDENQLFRLQRFTNSFLQRPQPIRDFQTTRSDLTAKQNPLHRPLRNYYRYTRSRRSTHSIDDAWWH